MKPNPKLTYLDILAAIALAIVLSSLNLGCSAPNAKILVIEDWTYQIPIGREQPTIYYGWKGWI